MACPTTEDCEQLLTLCDLAPPNFPSWMSQSDRQKLVDSCPSFKSYQDLCSDGFKVFESTTSVEATVSVELELSSTSDPTNHSTQSPAILHSLSNESDDIAWVAPLVLFLLLSTAVFLVALWYCRKNKLRLVSVDMKMYTETNYFHNKAIKGERWGQSDQIPSKKKKKKKSNFYNILKKTDGKPTGATKMSKNKDRDGTETDC
ncbi:hypothetical protein ScPMuIL_013658 [Solemya velum]